MKKHISKLVMVPCNQCGKQMLRYPMDVQLYKNIFCSRDCSEKWRKGRNIVELVCDYCGIDFTKQKSQVHERNYCSYQCFHDNAKAKHTYICPECGNKFHRKTQQVVRRHTPCCSGECARKYSGVNVEVTCVYCGKSWHKSKSSAKNITFCSEECRYAFTYEERICECGEKFVASKKSKKKFCSKSCYMNSITGENSAWYVDGKGYEYQTGYTREFRRVSTVIRQRDGKCVVCGKKKNNNGTELDVHHINHDKTDHALDNLVALCRECHARETVSKGLEREQWIYYFYSLTRKTV